MNKRDAAKLAKCSVRARKLYARVARGKWYPAYEDRTPAATQELVDAGLVRVMGRVEVWRACYVPKGTKPGTPETFPPVDQP